MYLEKDVNPRVSAGAGEGREKRRSMFNYARRDHGPPGAPGPFRRGLWFTTTTAAAAVADAAIPSSTFSISLATDRA